MLLRPRSLLTKMLLAEGAERLDKLFFGACAKVTYITFVTCDACKFWNQNLKSNIYKVLLRDFQEV